jgi:hypothetical protein
MAFPLHRRAGMSAAAPLDFDSTLVRRGVRATTISDMQVFVDAIQTRPLDKLIADLPGLAQLSDMKLILARQVIRRRLRDLPEVEREELRKFANRIAETASARIGERILRLFQD